MKKKKAKMSWETYKRESAEIRRKASRDFLQEEADSSRETVGKLVSEELPETRKLIQSITKR